LCKRYSTDIIKGHTVKDSPTSCFCCIPSHRRTVHGPTLYPTSSQSSSNIPPLPLPLKPNIHPRLPRSKPGEVKMVTTS
jgi:hypothetical protein